MAVSRAEKEQELQELTSAFQAATTAILVDYRGMNVPAVTELRRQLRAANARYRVVKNTLAVRASKGTAFEVLDKHFEGTTAVAYTENDAVALAKTLTTFLKTAPTVSIKAAVVQGRAIKPAEVDRAGGAARQARAVREVVVPAAGPDAATRDGAVGNARGISYRCCRSTRRRSRKHRASGSRLQAPGLA